MENIRIYDNGGKTFDRYTVAFMDRPIGYNNLVEMLGASEHPFNAQGFGQHCHGQPGRHLGKRITLEQCPPDVQQFIKQNL